MSNFYGKRFLSALMGALSVLGSPVASAVGGKLGKGNLKGEVESSAGRSKNGGKGGKLEVNREVKSVNGLKGVLKETGGKVVRVSPDGKGGFVAFVKTPRGIVTVAIVSVSLLAIITFLVFHGRKSNKGSGEITIGGDDLKSENLIDNTSLDINKNNAIDDAKGGLLAGLFGGNQGRYDLFVDRFFKIFIVDSDAKRAFLHDFGGDLDRFLESVFKRSSFEMNGSKWSVCIGDNIRLDRFIHLENYFRSVALNSESAQMFFGKVFEYLYGRKLVKIPESGVANWEDKISSLLFGFWYSVKFNLDIENDAKNVRGGLEESKDVNFGEIFNIIKSYVESLLVNAGRSVVARD